MFTKCLPLTGFGNLLVCEVRRLFDVFRSHETRRIQISAPGLAHTRPRQRSNRRSDYSCSQGGRDRNLLLMAATAIGRGTVNSRAACDSRVRSGSASESLMSELCRNGDSARLAAGHWHSFPTSHTLFVDVTGPSHSTKRSEAC
jgi:hypothetical protein